MPFNSFLRFISQDVQRVFKHSDWFQDHLRRVKRLERPDKCKGCCNTNPACLLLQLGMFDFPAECNLDRERGAAHERGKKDADLVKAQQGHSRTVQQDRPGETRSEKSFRLFGAITFCHENAFRKKKISQLRQNAAIKHLSRLREESSSAGKTNYGNGRPATQSSGVLHLQAIKYSVHGVTAARYGKHYICPPHRSYIHAEAKLSSQQPRLFKITCTTV